MTYVLVDPNDEIIKEETDIGDDVGTKPGYRWLPLENNGVPSYDPKTQYPQGPVYLVGEDLVVKTWTILNKTAQQIDQDKAMVVDSQHHVLLLALYELDKSIKILNGVEPLTFEQYKSSLKNYV